MEQWQLQDAKARLSELIKSAHDEGPQQVTVRGKPSAIVISVEEFEAMKRQRPRFVDLMRSSPWVGEELVIKRSDSLTRNIPCELSVSCRSFAARPAHGDPQ